MGTGEHDAATSVTASPSIRSTHPSTPAVRLSEAGEASSPCTPGSERLSTPNVRLFANTPSTSRFRRPSSPLRTNVVIDVSTPPSASLGRPSTRVQEDADRSPLATKFAKAASLQQSHEPSSNGVSDRLRPSPGHRVLQHVKPGAHDRRVAGKENLQGESTPIHTPQSHRKVRLSGLF